MKKAAGWLGLAVLVMACGGAEDATEGVQYPPPPPADTADIAAAPAPPPPPPAPPIPPVAAVAQSSFATVNGLKMHYLRMGERHGEARPVLVLLHPGGLGASIAWSSALPFFAEKYDVIAPDQVGQGGTPDDAKHPMTVHAMAEDTVALLAQLGVTRAILVGWSDGANLALDIGMNHPDRVVKIVASSGNFNPAGADPQVTKIFFHLKADDPSLQPARDAYAKESPDGAAHFAVVFDRLRKMWQTDPHWTTRQLATIKAPTLIIAGDHDAVLTTHTVTLAAAIPGSELAILPHADHEVPLNDAPRWNAVVQAFLEEKGAAPKGL